MGMERKITIAKQGDIAKLPVPEKGNKRYPVDDSPGLAVVVTSKGTRSFVLRYRFKGSEKLYTIGSHPDWKLAAARGYAKELRRGIDAGMDPKAQRDDERAAPTVFGLCDRFEEEILPRLRESTQAAYKGVIAQFIKPAWGSRKAADITVDDAETLHRDITKGKRTRSGKPAPIRANRVKAYGSKIFSQAVRWRIVTENPFKGIETNPENKRRRYFSQAEIVAIGEALDSYPAQIAADCIRLIMLTGCRPGEARTATWEQFDLEKGVWEKPGATTKQKTDHRVPLSAPALELLQRMRKERPDSEWVFHGRRKTEALTQIHSVWGYVRKKAKLKDARAHDLRHTYASILASGGLSLPIIGALLGHTQPATTARYAHLYDEPLKEAAEAVGRFISSAGNKAADVQSIRGRT
jgi:integrase